MHSLLTTKDVFLPHDGKEKGDVVVARASWSSASTSGSTFSPASREKPAVCRFEHRIALLKTSDLQSCSLGRTSVLEFEKPIRELRGLRHSLHFMNAKNMRATVD